MMHVLARDSAAKAAAAKTLADATYHATATAFGCTNAHHGLNDFMARMDAIIASAGDSEQPDPSQPTSAEIAFFEKIEREALANQTTR